MSKVVNGEVVELTPEEQAELQTSWDQEDMRRAGTEYLRSRQQEYPSLVVQLDMMYQDKMNGTTTWEDKITEIKTRYPKPAAI